MKLGQTKQNLVNDKARNMKDPMKIKQTILLY